MNARLNHDELQRAVFPVINVRYASLDCQMIASPDLPQVFELLLNVHDAAKIHTQGTDYLTGAVTLSFNHLHESWRRDTGRDTAFRSANGHSKPPQLVRFYWNGEPG